MRRRLDRTRHEVSSGRQTWPQPCLEEATSDRCVRNSGFTVGDRERTPPGRVSIQVRLAPSQSSASSQLTDAQELLKSPQEAAILSLFTKEGSEAWRGAESPVQDRWLVRAESEFRTRTTRVQPFFTEHHGSPQLSTSNNNF